MEQDASRRRRWFEPGGLLPALAVVVGTFAVWGASAVADDNTAPRTETATAGQTVRLYTDPDEHGVTVRPTAGWTIVATGSTTSLTLRHEHAVVVFDFAGEVEDLGNFFDRKARELDTSADVEVVESGEQRTPTGFAGVRGSAAADGRVGELVVLGKDKKAVSVLSLADRAHAADHQAAVTAMVSSIEEEK